MQVIAITPGSESKNREHGLFRRIAPWALAAFLLLPGLTEAEEAADTLTLKKEAYVKGPRVLLGDLAEIEGGNAAELAKIEIASAALPGSAKLVTASYVESRVRRAGIAPGATFTGAERISIITQSLTLSKQDIAEDLRQFILAKMPWDADNADVSVNMPATSLVIPDGAVDITWRSSPQYRYLGAGAFTGTVKVDGRPEKTLLVRATIAAYAGVVVAARDIPRGRPLSRADLEIREQSLAQTAAGALTRIEDAIGMLSRKTIFPGQTVTRQHIEAPKIIKRNQLVNVQMRSGGLFIQTRAKAMNDARTGDVVVCANPVTKKQFQGIARKDGVVVVE